MLPVKGSRTTRTDTSLVLPTTHTLGSEPAIRGAVPGVTNGARIRHGGHLRGVQAIVRDGDPLAEAISAR